MGQQGPARAIVAPTTFRTRNSTRTSPAGESRGDEVLTSSETAAAGAAAMRGRGKGERARQAGTGVEEEDDDQRRGGGERGEGRGEQQARFLAGCCASDRRGDGANEAIPDGTTPS